MTLTDLMVEYSNQVLSGEIIACQKHKWACQRFLNDLERQGTEDFPYIFDEEKALLFFDWMRLFKHTKGPLADQHKEPTDIEIFIFGNLYGWYHKDTGYRRFKKLYWQVARKNAKSQDLAIVGLYETLANNRGAKAETYCAATKTEQARIVWEEAETILRRCKELEGKYEIKYGRIIHTKTGSFMRALSKEDRKKADGFSPKCAIIDEYHAHETDEIYNIMASGMGAHPDRLLIVITTAGFEINHPCYKIEYPYVSQILDPNNPVKNEEYFVIINELDRDKEGNLLDDIKDEKVWEKANPILASYEEGLDYLRSRMKEALDVPEKMRDFLTKNMNVWINAREGGYMDLAKWKLCENKIPDLNGHECYVGVDLSSKIDLSSVAFIFPLEDGRFVVLSHSFIPENNLRAKILKDKVSYDRWAQEGWITLTDGSVIDFNYIEKYVEEEAEKNGWVVREVCYDPWNATQFANNMMDKGFECVEIRQGYATLSEATKNFRELVYQKKIIHDGNPVLTWAIGNAVVSMDRNENIRLDKSKSTLRIDPIAAVINAHVRAMLHEPPKKSVYEGRGLRFV